jgi:predicted ATPase
VAIETPPPLLERQRELAELGSALTEARQGRGQVVLIEASAGLGKTSLLRVACQTAVAAGFTCLRARASELERDFAFGCVRQLLEPAVARTSDADRNRLFEGAAALSKPLFAPTGAPQPSLWGDSSFRMLHGLYWLLSNLADEGPVALSVDDLHWSDTESLRFFNYLAPRLDGLPLAVLASTRSGEQVTVDLARLATGPETTRLRPEPLSIEATAVLCERRLGRKVAHNFAAACRDATGGNPFFLEALLREAKEQSLSTDARDAAHVRRIGPTAVAESLLLRLSGAPAAGGAVVRAVAVLGDGASLTEVAGLAELADEEVARTADVLVALAILRPGEGLEFAHPIVREAVYTNIGPRERGKVHARAAGILAASGPPRSGSRPSSPRPRRPATRSGSSSCAGWPSARSSAERPPPLPPGSGARWWSLRRRRPGRRCSSSWAPRSCASQRRGRLTTSPRRSSCSGNRGCSLPRFAGSRAR